MIVPSVGLLRPVRYRFKCPDRDIRQISPLMTAG